MAFEKELKQQLEQLKEKDLYRQRKTVSHSEGVHVTIDRQQFLSFCSNDYLGLATHPEIKKAFQQGIERYGVGSGASHLISGHSLAHHTLEEKLAEFVGRPRALLFSSGYMANIGIINALTERNDTIITDKLNHASLTEGALLSQAKFLRYPHADLSKLREQMQKASGRVLLSTDSVFSMDGDIAPIVELLSISKQYNKSVLFVDDAHGFGVLGANGQGTLEHLGVNNETPVLMATLGKACGVAGAFVAGSEALIETLIQKAKPYIYTTAQPPALAHATIKALQLLADADDKREHLKQLIHYFRQAMFQLGITLPASETPIQPFIIGTSRKALDLSEKLYAANILVSAIRPPTVPKNSARLRITLSARHTFADVDWLVDCIERFR